MPSACALPSALSAAACGPAAKLGAAPASVPASIAIPAAAFSRHVRGSIRRLLLGCLCALGIAPGALVRTNDQTQPDVYRETAALRIRETPTSQAARVGVTSQPADTSAAPRRGPAVMALLEGDRAGTGEVELDGAHGHVHAGGVRSASRASRAQLDVLDACGRSQ